ncbi:MAG: hypothetical protein P9L91_08355, partial [Candidatus Zophobacter franzmannii]|nr:hypothetical protein [Candidatus Zophobacter franzmannii]
AGLYEGSFGGFFTFSEQAGRPDFRKNVEGGQIIVVTDSDFVNDKGAGKQPNNLNFVLNASDYLVGDLSALEIRSRSISMSRLDVRQWLLRDGRDPVDLDGEEKRVKLIAKSLNIVLPALLMIIAGFIYVTIRRKKSEKIRRMYE